MTKPLADDRERHTGRELQAGGPVAQVVEPLDGKSRMGGDDLELPADVVGRVARAQRVGEREVVTGVGHAEAPALLQLLQPVRQQRADGSAVEVDPAVLTVTRLGRSDDQPPAVPDDLLADGQAAALEVDVLPPQAHCLPPAQAGQRHELQERAEPVVAGLVEEASEFIDLVRSNRRSLSRLQLNADRGVVWQQLAAHRRVERGPQHGVQADDGRGAHGFPALDTPAAAKPDLRIHPLDVHGPQMPQLDVS